MAKRLFHLYADIPDGTDCHRKAYASTAIGGAVGEPRPGLEGGGRVEVAWSVAPARAGHGAENVARSREG